MTKDIADSVKAKVSIQALNRETTTELALTALLAGGHILFAGPTGVGKTQWARAFSNALGLSYNRIRFTEDGEPSEIFCARTLDYEGHRVPMYSNIFHGDDVGNAHSNVHTALMDIMEPGCDSVTIEGRVYNLPVPFFVIASSQEIHTIPEALTDRFMMMLTANYPGMAAEKQILQMHHKKIDGHGLAPACTLEDIAQVRHEVQTVAVEEVIFNYIISIVETIRRVGAVQAGPCPRGSIAMLYAAKAYAAIQGRDYVVADDIRSLALPVLRHRIKLKRDAMQEGIQSDHIIESIIANK